VRGDLDGDVAIASQVQIGMMVLRLRDLADAIEEVLTDKPVSVAETTIDGCKVTPWQAPKLDYQVTLHEHVEGNVLVGDPASRTRFATRLRFSTDHTWKEFSIRVSQRLVSWEIRAAGADETILYADADFEAAKQLSK
jgi:predicted double-glycine peptidase